MSILCLCTLHAYISVWEVLSYSYELRVAYKEENSYYCNEKNLNKHIDIQPDQEIFTSYVIETKTNISIITVI